MKYVLSFLFIVALNLQVYSNDLVSLPDLNKTELFQDVIENVELDLTQRENKESVPVSQNPPKSIIGRTYVTIYNYDGKYNDYFTVTEAPNDSIILKGYACGYDIKGKYDSNTGTLTIPTGMVIGKSFYHTEENAILYSQIDQSVETLGNAPIIGTVDGEKITFNNGLWVAEIWEGKILGIIAMQHMEAIESNARMTFMTNGNNYNIPLRIQKSTEDELSTIGISSYFGPRYYEVPVKLNKSTNSASISQDTPVGFLKFYDTTYFLLSLTYDSKIKGDLDFSVLTSDKESVLSATTNAGYYYKEDVAMGIKPGGAILYGLKITTDFNIYTAPVGTDDFNNSAGIKNIEIDKDTVAEYYNLQGQKVNGEHLTPGIYIVRRGSKASKILVR